MLRRFLSGCALMVFTLTISLASQGGEKAAPKLPTPPTIQPLRR